MLIFVFKTNNTGNYLFFCRDSSSILIAFGAVIQTRKAPCNGCLQEESIPFGNF